MRNSKRQKFLILTLGILFLTVVSLGDLTHNHPLSQKETPSCPAYILSFSIHFEPVTPPIISVALPEPVSTFSFTTQEPTLEFVTQTFLNRAPPLFLA